MLYTLLYMYVCAHKHTKTTFRNANFNNLFKYPILSPHCYVLKIDLHCLRRQMIFEILRIWFSTYATYTYYLLTWRSTQVIKHTHILKELSYSISFSRKLSEMRLVCSSDWWWRPLSPFSVTDASRELPQVLHHSRLCRSLEIMLRKLRSEKANWLVMLGQLVRDEVVVSSQVGLTLECQAPG